MVGLKGWLKGGGVKGVVEIHNTTNRNLNQILNQNMVIFELKWPSKRDLNLIKHPRTLN